ncbi:hypothetical protein QOT17_010813 [Balamuthia mandrillaris]
MRGIAGGGTGRRRLPNLSQAAWFRNINSNNNANSCAQQPPPQQTSLAPLRNRNNKQLQQQQQKQPRQHSHNHPKRVVPFDEEPEGAFKELMEKGKDADVARFVDIIAAPVRSAQVVARMELEDVPTDPREFFLLHDKQKLAHWNLLFKAQGRNGNIRLVLRTFDLMKEEGVSPDLSIYTTLIRQCANAKAVDTALALFEEMKNVGLEPTLWTWGALVKVYCASGELQKAFGVLTTLSSLKLQPNIVIFTTLIQGCLGKGDVDMAWKTFEYMRQQTPLEPDEVTFTVMINACAKKQQVERALNLFSEMQQMGQTPTEVTFNSLIYACATRPDYYEDAFITYERMKSSGYVPNAVTYGTLLYAAASNGDVKAAETLFSELQESGQLKAGNPVPWTSLMQAYRTAQVHASLGGIRTRNIERVQHLFNAMLEYGTSPTLRTLNTVLSTITAAHHVRTAEAFWEAIKQGHFKVQAEDGEEMEEKRVEPDLHSYTCMVQLYGETRKAEKLLEMWHEMKENGIAPDMRAYDHAVRGLAKAKYLNTALRMLREMREKGWYVKSETKQLLLKRFQEYPEQLEEVRQLCMFDRSSIVEDPKKLLAMKLKGRDHPVSTYKRFA